MAVALPVPTVLLLLPRCDSGVYPSCAVPALPVVVSMKEDGLSMGLVGWG
jgi:hypothetical protein